MQKKKISSTVERIIFASNCRKLEKFLSEIEYDRKTILERPGLDVPLRKSS